MYKPKTNYNVECCSCIYSNKWCFQIRITTFLPVTFSTLIQNLFYLIIFISVHYRSTIFVTFLLLVELGKSQRTKRLVCSPLMTFDVYGVVSVLDLSVRPWSKVFCYMSGWPTSTSTHIDRNQIFYSWNLHYLLWCDHYSDDDFFMQTWK